MNKKKIANYNETVSIEREEPKDVGVTGSWVSLKEILKLSDDALAVIKNHVENVFVENDTIRYVHGSATKKRR